MDVVLSIDGVLGILLIIMQAQYLAIARPKWLLLSAYCL